MDNLIQIFRMNEISIQSRIKIIKKLGQCINHQYASNITEPLVYELILALNPEDSIQYDSHYKQFIKD